MKTLETTIDPVYKLIFFVRQSYLCEGQDHYTVHAYEINVNLHTNIMHSNL